MRRYTDDELFEFQQRLRPLLRHAERYVGGGFDREYGVLDLTFTHPAPAEFELAAAQTIPADVFHIRVLPEGHSYSCEAM